MVSSGMEVQFMIDTIYARAVVELAKEKGLDLRELAHKALNLSKPDVSVRELRRSIKPDTQGRLRALTLREAYILSQEIGLSMDEIIKKRNNALVFIRIKTELKLTLRKRRVFFYTFFMKNIRLPLTIVYGSRILFSTRRGTNPKGENRMNDTIRIEEIVEQYSDGTEYTIYLVWNATVQGQWESFTSYEEAIRFIREVTLG